MEYRKEQIGRPDLRYGGILKDISEFPIGTRFNVENGCWVGEIVDLGSGIKGCQAYTLDGGKVGSPYRLEDIGSVSNLCAVSGIIFPDHEKLERKTLSLDQGRYTIVFDDSGSYPEKCLRHGELWRDLAGDNLIFWLVAELEAARTTSEPNHN